MADLPVQRVTASRPFANVGVDYCGPFYVKEKKYRNTKRVKVYVAVYVCQSTKAIHLEVVSEMSTSAFFASFKRFVSRRGLPQLVSSDNGSNFKGASNDLKELAELINDDKHQSYVNQQAVEMGIKWRFIPSYSPNFGGLWEAAVKIFKHHLKRVVGDSLFTYEEFETLVLEIKAILNSRPLTPLSSDPNDLSALTPGHFLIGCALRTISEQDVTEMPSNRLSRWQHISKVKQHFWSRWHKEYLNELHLRSKWKAGEVRLEIGTLVLMKEKCVPPLCWKMGRIVSIHPGSDKNIRVANIKTAKGETLRNIRDLVILPIESSE